MKNTSKGLVAVGIIAAALGGTYIATQDEPLGGPVRAPMQLHQLYVDVAQTYGVSAADDGKRVGEFYAIGTDTLDTGLKWAWKRWKKEGMDYGTFRSRFLGPAIIKDVAWYYEGDDNINRGLQNAYSFADFSHASGCWKFNITAPVPRAGIKGASSFGHWDEGTTDLVFASCEFEMVDSVDWWPFAQTDRRLLETPNSSLGTPDNGSYQEGITIESLHLTGPFNWSGGSIKRTGLYGRRLGECAYLNQLNVAGFDYGIMLNGGVPVTAGTITGFFNKIAVALFGCWGMTFSFQTISGDQNEELLGSHPGYGDEAGGRIFGGLLKDEDGLHAKSAKTPYRWQTALYLEGQYSCTIGVISTARGGITQDAMVLINPRMVNGTPQGSSLNICSAIGFNYKTAIHNLATGERVASPGDYQSFSLRHYANGNRYVLNDQVVTPTACNCPPLGGITGPGNYNYTACTPLKGGAAPPPPPCSWVPGTTTCTNCVGGSQTCTTPWIEPAGCTPTTAKPAPVVVSRSCTVGMTASVPTGFVDGSHTPDKGVDADPASYWMGNRSMTGDGTQWYDVTFASPVKFKTVTITTPTGWLSSYARYVDVVAFNGSAKVGEKLLAPGQYPSTTVLMPAEVTATRVVVTCRRGDINWWGIANFSVQ